LVDQGEINPNQSKQKSTKKYREGEQTVKFKLITTLSHIKPWGNADTAGGSTLKFPAATAARFVKALVMPLRVPPQYPPPRF